MARVRAGLVNAQSLAPRYGEGGRERPRARRCQTGFRDALVRKKRELRALSAASMSGSSSSPHARPFFSASSRSVRARTSS
jgi:hypothetical protein